MQPDPNDAVDPVKATIHARLQTATAALQRVSHNRHYDLSEQTRTLVEKLDGATASLPYLGIHLDIETLRRLYETRDSRSGEDILTPDEITLLAQIVREGPGLTLDNGQVTVFEKPQNRLRDQKLKDAEIGALGAISKSITKDPAAYDQSLRDLHAVLLAGVFDKTDRLGSGQQISKRNILVAAGSFIVATFASAEIVLATPAINAWLIEHYSVVLEAAATFGEPFVAWITPIMMRLQEAANAAKALTLK